VHGTAPAYLADSLQLTANVQARRHLRYTDTVMLQVPLMRRSTLGDRAFPVAALEPGMGCHLQHVLPTRCCSSSVK